MIGAGVRVVAALARGAEPHRLLSGDGPSGPWCGVGVSDPVLVATARTVAAGPDAPPLAGARAGEPAGTDEVTFTASGDAGGVLAEARSRLVALGSSAARSWLVALGSGDGPLEVWLALGPPACSIAVRCWPGLPQARDAAGEEGAPAPLALAAEALCAALGSGTVPAGRAEAVLAAAQATAVAEGVLAERHARLMDAAGDDRGGAVRRLVAQAYAVDVALAALHEALG